MSLTTSLINRPGPFVEIAFKSDPALCSTWHIISGSPVSECIEHTVVSLKNCETLQFYGVWNQKNDFVGYFGTEYDGAYMPTIFIMPQFRKDKSEFWKEVQAKTKPTWRGGCFVKNIPCMRFYAKMGNEVGRITPDLGEAAVFEFRKGS